MKKSIILKSFLVILVCAMFIFAITPVYAATDEGFEDVFNMTNTSNTSNTNIGNTNTRNTNTNTNTRNVQNVNALRNTANTTNTLPKTGIEDSLPTVLLVVVFGISAVYAYKKIKDYRNID